MKDRYLSHSFHRSDRPEAVLKHRRRVACSSIPPLPDSIDGSPIRDTSRRLTAASSDLNLAESPRNQQMTPQRSGGLYIFLLIDFVWITTAPGAVELLSDGIALISCELFTRERASLELDRSLCDLYRVT